MSKLPLWTIDELGARVALVLSAGYDGVRNGRVRDVPDLRTIRYYTTLGLLDRPVEMRGRTAYYGPRHLEQLIAIKRLQARGLSLAEIQEQLVGMKDADLRRIADVPAKSLREPSGAAVGATNRRRAEPAGKFWATQPQPPAAIAIGAAAAPSPAPSGQSATFDSVGGHSLQTVPLVAGALLVFAPSRPVEESDIEAIRSAAAPLTKLLTRRRLVPADPAKGEP